MLDRKSLGLCAPSAVRALRVASRVAASLVPLALTTAFLTPFAHADKGDCSQPVSTGESPAASDCLSILRTAVGSTTCSPECICAPKGTLPVSATDALLCLRHSVGLPVVLDCPCEQPTTTTTTTIKVTTTTLATGVVGAIPLRGRMNANLQLGLPAASAACAEHFAGSDYCLYGELVAAEGAGLAGLEDVEGDPVTSLWAIDPNQSSARQCGQTLSESAPHWTYATAHLGVGGDSVALTNATGMLGELIVGGDGNRNCNVFKSVACCR